MARSEWDEICPKCKGGKEIEEEKHGKVSRKTCPECRGTGELDPKKLIQNIEGGFKASPLNVVGFHYTNLLIKASKELTRRLELAEKQLGKRVT